MFFANFCKKKKKLQNIYKTVKCQQGPNAFWQHFLTQSLLLFNISCPSKSALGPLVNEILCSEVHQLCTCWCCQSGNQPKISGGQEWMVGESGSEQEESDQQVIYSALSPSSMSRNKQELCHCRQHAWSRITRDPRECLERFTSLPFPSSSFVGPLPARRAMAALGGHPADSACVQSPDPTVTRCTQH